MCKSRSGTWWLALSMSLLFGLGLIGAADLPPELSREKIVAHMQVGAGSTDWYGVDSEYERTYRLIVENGDATLPILEELLRSAEEWEFAQQATDLIGALNVSDRQKKVRIIKAVMTGEISVEDPVGRIKTSILDFLPRWGEPQDVTWILPSLQSSFDETVGAAVRVIGEVGDVEGGEAMMKALRERQARLSAEQLVGDPMLKGGEDALAKIAARAAAKKSAGSSSGADGGDSSKPVETSALPPPNPSSNKQVAEAPHEPKGATKYGEIVAVGVAIVAICIVAAWLRRRRKG